MVSDVPYVNGAPRGWVVAGTLRRLLATQQVCHRHQMLTPVMSSSLPLRTSDDILMPSTTTIGGCGQCAWSWRGNSEDLLSYPISDTPRAAPFDTVLREPMLSVPVVATMGDDETSLQQLLQLPCSAGAVSSGRSFASQRAQSTGAWCSRGSTNKDFTAHQQCPVLFRLH